MAYTIFTEGFYLTQWRLAGGLVVRANVKRPLPVIIDEPDFPAVVVMVLPDWVGSEFSEVMAAYCMMELRMRVTGPLGVVVRLLEVMALATEPPRMAAD
jgi:hypothetical protein